MAEHRKIALVTGASSGIGAATARRLSEENYFVYCAARRAEKLHALVGEIEGRAVPCDVTDADDVERLAHTIGESLDVLVNNAGGAIGLDLVEDADPTDWRRMYELNVVGTLRVTQALLPSLLASGGSTIVNVGSTAGHEVYERGGGYVAAKHGLAMLTQQMRRDVFGKPIRVSEVAPGMVKSEGILSQSVRRRSRARRCRLRRCRRPTDTGGHRRLHCVGGDPAAISEHRPVDRSPSSSDLAVRSDEKPVGRSNATPAHRQPRALVPRVTRPGVRR